MVKSFKYSISAEKDLIGKRDFETENGINYNNDIVSLQKLCVHGGMCVLSYFLYIHYTFAYIKM